MKSKIFEAGKVFENLEDVIEAGLPPIIKVSNPTTVTVAVAYLAWRSAGVRKWHGRWIWA